MECGLGREEGGQRKAKGVAGRNMDRKKSQTVSISI
jgi:hypothetical protein